MQYVCIQWQNNKCRNAGMETRNRTKAGQIAHRVANPNKSTPMTKNVISSPTYKSRNQD